jgi:DNA polymerase III alpha subunit
LKYNDGNQKSLTINEVTTDQYGRVIYNRHDLYELLYNGADISTIQEVEWHEDFEKFNEAITLNHLSTSQMKPLRKYNFDVSEFDAERHSQWFIPEEYMKMDVCSYIRNKTPMERLERVDTELELYDKYDLLDILKICVYLVDTMRDNKVLWGVGRGSSVASYVLYIIGIHKVDSVKYGLDIKEFLK